MKLAVALVVFVRLVLKMAVVGLDRWAPERFCAEADRADALSLYGPVVLLPLATD